MNILAWIGLIVGVLVVAWLFDHFFDFFSWIFCKITGKSTKNAAEQFDKIKDEI